MKKSRFFLRKPDTLSLLYRLEGEKEDKQQLTVTMLAGFRLDPNSVQLDEGSFWQPIKELDSVPFDLGLPKPEGEFLVAGSCYPPNGQSVLACPVQVKVGHVEKNIAVFGDRWWTHADRMTFPVPFKQIKLDWKQSFGGEPGYDNPDGRGRVPVRCPDGRMRIPLPNIQYPDRLIGSATERQRPVGFGPEGLDWLSRRALVGSLDKKWLARSWPKPPHDALPGLFQLSPPDQRVSDFFHGDEQIILRNMHSLRSRIESQLPGRRCRCFLGSRSTADAQQILEMQCRLDTLWLFPDHETGILIWRAQLNGLPAWHTNDYYLAATLEHLAESPKDATNCYCAILGLPNAVAKEISTDESSVPEPDTPQQLLDAGTVTQPKIDPLAAAIAEKITAAKAKLTPLLAAFGISADELLGQPTSNTGKNAKILTPARLEQRAAQLHKKLESSLLGTGLAPEDLQPDTSPSPSRKNKGSSIATAIAAMKSYGIEDEALFAEMRALEQQTDQVETKKQNIIPEKPGSNLPPTAVMTRDEVLAVYAKGDSLAGLDLSGLDLSGVLLDRVDFREAILDGVNFNNTSLRGADLSGALLNRADCSGALLTESILKNCVAIGIVATGADFSKADLCNARFDKGDFSRACFANISGYRAGFSSCILLDTDARKADLHRADFKGADLTSGCFSDADLRSADFNRALLDKADFRRSNLEAAWFSEAEGDDVIFCNAKLSRSKCNSTCLPGADFSEADMRQVAWSESIFTEACLRQGMLDQSMLVQCDFRRADFSRASLRRANLMHSDLRQTSLYKANGFKARLRHTRLEESNCCEANLYGADLYKAALLHTLLDRANLDATLFSITLSA